MTVQTTNQTRSKTSIQKRIETKLAGNLTLKHLEVINESNNHNVAPGSESHFKLVLVSEDFADVRLIQRHRRVNEILAEELAGSVHAMAMHTYTEAEWVAKHGKTPLSPPCLGGSDRKS